ncbi:MAG: hypothetical protein GX750_02350 [Clostridia bacterium]|nr:hypothetical protein [Clostridia bacterium]
MSVVLATAETGQLDTADRNLRLICSPSLLNRSYQQYDRQFNCLCSNWDWFVNYQEEKHSWLEVKRQIDQN